MRFGKPARTCCFRISTLRVCVWLKYAWENIVFVAMGEQLWNVLEKAIVFQRQPSYRRQSEIRKMAQRREKKRKQVSFFHENFAKAHRLNVSIYFVIVEMGCTCKTICISPFCWKTRKHTLERRSKNFWRQFLVSFPIMQYKKSYRCFFFSFLSWCRTNKGKYHHKMLEIKSLHCDRYINMGSPYLRLRISPGSFYCLLYNIVSGPI